jgi:hypothetical protein
VVHYPLLNLCAASKICGTGCAEKGLPEHKFCNTTNI